MNLKEAFHRVDKCFSQWITEEVNDQYSKVAKIKGQDIPWHNHENEDEMFYIIEGQLIMEVENQPDFIMKKGDLYVVKKCINHRVSSPEECLIILIETKTIEHTGKVKTGITKSIDEQLY